MGEFPNKTKKRTCSEIVYSREMRRFIIGVLMACGGSSAPTTAAPQEVTSPQTPPSTTPTLVSPRKKLTTTVVKILADATLDNDTRARIAAEAFDEGGYFLPAGLHKALGGVSGTNTKANDCSFVLWEGLRAAKPAVEKRCGGFNALKEHVEAVAAARSSVGRASMVKAVTETCKVTDVPDADASRLDPWALLASAIVGDLLAEDSQSSADEQQMARALMYLCAIPPAK